MTTTTTPAIKFRWNGGTIDISAGQTASWFYRLATEACVVDARCTTIDFKPCDLADAYWVIAEVPGTVIDGFLPGMIDNVIGKVRHHHIQAYGYGVRERIANGDGPWFVVEAE